MNSIETMALDMERQVTDLPQMAMPRHLSGPIAFVGSGDSYVAGLAAHYLSSGRTSCHYSADVIANPLIARGHIVCFVSISGRTRANVLAARAAQKAGLHTVALTADPSSDLAKTCNNVAKLSFHGAGKTAGTLSFTTSLLACSSLATKGEVTCPDDIEAIYRDASKRAAVLVSKTDGKSIFILGNSLFYPAAMYGALKFNEVLGARAVAYPLEDFFHAPLFGVQEGEVAIIIGNDSRPATTLLRKAGLRSVHVDCKENTIGSLLYAVFFMQHLVLQIAKKQNQKECYFINDKKLSASSSFIY